MFGYGYWYLGWTRSVGKWEGRLGGIVALWVGRFLWVYRDSSKGLGEVMEEEEEGFRGSGYCVFLFSDFYLKMREDWLLMEFLEGRLFALFFFFVRWFFFWFTLFF